MKIIYCEEVPSFMLMRNKRSKLCNCKMNVFLIKEGGEYIYKSGLIMRNVYVNARPL